MISLVFALGSIAASSQDFEQLLREYRDALIPVRDRYNESVGLKDTDGARACEMLYRSATSLGKALEKRDRIEIYLAAAPDDVKTKAREQFAPFDRWTHQYHVLIARLAAQVPFQQPTGIGPINGGSSSAVISADISVEAEPQPSGEMRYALVDKASNTRVLIVPRLYTHFRSSVLKKDAPASVAGQPTEKEVAHEIKQLLREITTSNDEARKKFFATFQITEAKTLLRALDTLDGIDESSRKGFREAGTKLLDAEIDRRVELFNQSLREETNKWKGKVPPRIPQFTEYDERFTTEKALKDLISSKTLDNNKALYTDLIKLHGASVQVKGSGDKVDIIKVTPY